MKDQRVVEAIKKEFEIGLQMIKRFHVGDAVAHVTVGDGEVTGNDGRTVTVTYAKTFKSGAPVRGCYDAIWFNQNPSLLFHRGTHPLAADETK